MGIVVMRVGRVIKKAYMAGGLLSGQLGLIDFRLEKIKHMRKSLPYGISQV